MAQNQALKEIKIPKYIKGMDFDDYYIKLLHAAGTRGEMKRHTFGKLRKRNATNHCKSGSRYWKIHK